MTAHAPEPILPPSASRRHNTLPASPTRVRRLEPEDTKIYEATFSLLHVAIQNDTLYRGVYALRMFPVRFPERFISLCYTDEEDKVREIGIIRELAMFPEDARRLVRLSLAKQYHEQLVSRIHKAWNEYGMLFFDVETQRGREVFAMPWRGDRAEDFGETGKVLLDAFDNRYVIPNLQELPTADRQALTQYVYW